MRRLLVAALLAISLSSSVGCFFAAYDADPAVRARQLIYTSEELRQLREEWHRFWLLDQPNHMYPYNTCLLYTSPSPRDATLSRMPSSA